MKPNTTIYLELLTDAGVQETFPVAVPEATGVISREVSVGKARISLTQERLAQERIAQGLDSGIYSWNIVVKVLEGEGKLFATLGFRFSPWSLANYLLMPAAVYGGNRVSIVTPDGVYPPWIEEGYTDLKPSQLTGVIKHLSPEGGGQMDFLSGEFAFPSMGFFEPVERRSFWIFTEQENEAGNFSYCVTEAQGATELGLRISSPAHRRVRQESCNSLRPADDPPMAFRAGTTITFKVVLRDEWCPTLEHFFWQAHDFRNAMMPQGEFPKVFPYSEAAKLIRERFEADNWFEEYGYYSTITKTDLRGICRNSRHQWQLGWVGGIMRNEYLLREGSHPERVLQDLHTLVTKAQQESGFFFTTANEGEYYPDWPPRKGAPLRREALVRKNADGLTFLCRQLLWLKNAEKSIEPLLLEGARKCAGAFCGLWEKYGQFGYLLDPVTGELLVGGGAGGAFACAGLCFASELFDEPKCLAVAREAAYDYAENWLLARGNVYGGVGDALQATDSESAYALLEALVTVWEYTGDKTLLAYAKTAADYLSTWIVSYDYKFPQDSAFGKLQMATAGTVYANIQNRHSAPGFCSASGEALWKLYRATGKLVYAQLAQKVAHSLPQYLSRPGRVIPGMEVVGLSERVNMGDWEGAGQVGEIANAPCACWPEVSLLLTRAHLPGVYANKELREILCFDHLEAEWHEHRLVIKNPTAFVAEATVLVEDEYAARIPLKINAYEHFVKVTVPPHGKVVV